MEQAQEKLQDDSPEAALDDLIVMVKTVARSPQHCELFTKIVEDFYDQVTEEYFSPEDLADIEEGFNQIKRGEYVTLEELENELGL